MYARISTIFNDGTSDERARRLAVARELFPATVAQIGCLGGMVLDDPSSGVLRVVMFWETSVAMIEARDAGQTFRENFAASIGIPVNDIDVQLCDVDTFDLSRVPATLRTSP